jgi:hypothetical protein
MTKKIICLATALFAVAIHDAWLASASATDY